MTDASALICALCGGMLFRRQALRILSTYYIRKDGLGELYVYAPLNETNKKVLLSAPNSKMNSDYGVSVGLGAWTFEPGIWMTVAERVKLNTVGNANGGSVCLMICREILTGRLIQGEIQLWINGVSVIHVKGLILREETASHIKGMHFQTFFGGDEG